MPQGHPCSQLCGVGRGDASNRRIMGESSWLYASRMCAQCLFQLQASVLDLFGDRLLSIAESARRQVTPTIVVLVERIITLLGRPMNGAVIPAFASLRAISTTLCPGEEGPMVACVPILVSALRDRKLAVSAITVLPVLWCVTSLLVLSLFFDEHP